MRWLSFILFFLFFFSGKAATIIGEVSDRASNQPIAGVSIQNIHSGVRILSDSNGKFNLEGTGDDLIEFIMQGYETTRFRVPKGKLPVYFKITLLKERATLPDYTPDGLYAAYLKDSIKYNELYKSAINFEKLTGLDVIRHPFSAMSKRNRQIWAFQKEFAYFQKEKFIDLTFNAAIVSNLTGLEGDSLTYYMRRFRPSYEQLHQMTEYSFYQYIRQNATFYRTGVRPDYKPDVIRSPY